MNDQVPPGADASAEGFATASKSLQAFATEMQRMAKESIEQSAHVLDQLRGAKSMEDVVALQSSFMQQSFQRYTEFAQRIGTLMQSSSMDFFRQMRPPKF